MMEPRAFYRGGLSTMDYLLPGVIAVNGIVYISEGRWFWGVPLLVLVVLAVVERSWSRRNPIVSVSDGLLVIRRHALARPKKYAIDAITTVDDTRLDRVRLALQDGQTVSIRLDWLEWGNRAPFVLYLKSILVEGNR